MSIRIIGLTEQFDIQSGDYIAIDSSVNGSHKFDVTKLTGNVAENFNESSSYVAGDYCVYEGQLYVCIGSTSGVWDSSKWSPTYVMTQLTDVINDIDLQLADKVDKVTGKVLSSNDFTDSLKNKLDGIEAGAEVNVQADWDESNTSADSYIKNKPSDATQSASGFMSAADKTKLDGIESGAEVNVQANWSESNSVSDAYIQNKPSIYTQTEVNNLLNNKQDKLTAGAHISIDANSEISASFSDATQSASGLMSSTDKTKLDGIAAGAEVNVQADWDETNSSSDAYIKNKPVIPAGSVVDPNLNPTSLNPVTNATITNAFYDTWDMICNSRETSSTATAAHANGSYFIMGQTLYKATANIAIGDTITAGTNCTAVAVTTEMGSGADSPLYIDADGYISCDYDKIPIVTV